MITDIQGNGGTRCRDL